ncbi:MAG: enolase C-terminal domain-like protein [Clostridia bacterium]
MVTIRDVKVFFTAPKKSNLVVVKIETSEPGLYGLGCATFAYRIEAVRCVIEQYLRPLLIGRDVSRIEELWQIMNNNAYWRNGPISNNAISGIDIALWDIKGKMANMPVYDLLGGKTREGVPVYRHATGRDMSELFDSIDGFLNDGVRYVRCQYNRYGTNADQKEVPFMAEGPNYELYIQPDQYMKNTIMMFDKIREKYGFDLEVCHDTHERVAARDAVYLAKRLEEHRLFFLEDLLSPEQSDWFKNVRNATTTPLAVGELYNNPKEWDYLIRNRLIDFIRVHTSQIGGLTPARKLAIFAEAFGVKTAWHGPSDISPIGHAMNVHLDYASTNFGIQEWNGINEELHEVFPGSPELRKGYVYLNNKPGFGVDFDEELAKKYPVNTDVVTWTQTRYVDGSPCTP